MRTSDAMPWGRMVPALGRAARVAAAGMVLLASAGLSSAATPDVTLGLGDYHTRLKAGDGLPDLYICNDFQTPDRFWLNQGSGKVTWDRRARILRQFHCSGGGSLGEP